MNVESLETIGSEVPLLGIILALSILVGKIAKKLGVPQVTAFLILGMIFGPHAFGVISSKMVNHFNFINQIAFGIILFNIGGEFNRDVIKNIKKKQFGLALFISFFLVSIVFTSIYYLCLYLGIESMQALIIASFLGFIAIEAAPPTTSLVIKQYDAQGPLTHSILIYLVFGTGLSIAGSNSLNFFYQKLGLLNGSIGDQHFITVLWPIIGSIFFGFLLGIILSYWEQKERKQGERLFAVFTFIMLGQSLAYYLMLDGLLISLMLGITVVNSSSIGREIHASIKNTGLSLYALFFIFAGTHIKIPQTMGIITILTIGYIISRIIGMILASYFSSKITNEDDNIRKYKGISLLSHAGGAIAIVTELKKSDMPITDIVYQVITTSIIFFELVGPFLLKYSLDKSGEVSTNNMLDSTSKGKVPIGIIIRNLTHNLNINLKENINDINLDQSIRHFIRTDIIAIRSDAPLSEIKKYLLEENKQKFYPIVNNKHQYLGIIDIHAINEIVNDNNFEKESHFAIDFIKFERSLPITIKRTDLEKHFTTTNSEIIAITDPKNRNLIGIINYKDIIIENIA